VFLNVGESVFIFYELEAHVTGGTGSGVYTVDASADASHTLYVILESLTPGASYTSASGIDYTKLPPNVQPPFQFQFTGFGEPITMGVTNTAQAGRAIPVIWRLTDLNGNPISDPTSFSGISSFQTACDLNSQTDPVDDHSSGSSSLQYLGNGYWQFNWKTEKTYAKTCRRMYLKLSDGQMSDQVKFSFK
jgi:hypothetical protein